MHVFLPPQLSSGSQNFGKAWGNLRKAWQIPGKAKSLGWQNPQDCKNPGTANSSGWFHPREGKIPRITKSPGQQNPGKSRAFFLVYI